MTIATPTPAAMLPPAAAHGSTAPSAWVHRWAHLLAPGSHVLDLACGAGRHSHLLAGHGMRVWSADRDAAALAAVSANWPAAATHPARTWHVDLEGGPWPWPGQGFDGIVVTNYLWRPLWPHVLAALAPGGLLLYETFAHGNASVGKPARPDFLLQPGELLQVCSGMRVVGYEDGFCTHPDRYVQRIAAVRLRPTASAQPDTPNPAPATETPLRFHLSAPRAPRRGDSIE